MADNGGQDLDQAVPPREDAPQPQDEQNAAGPGDGAGAATAEPLVTAGAEDAEQGLVRSAYVARTAAPEASSGDFSHMETADQGLLLRGAYLARLGDDQATAAGDHPAGEDIVRRAYVARMVAEPSPRSARLPRAKRRASARKAAAKKPAVRLSGRGAKAKSKARTQSKARSARVRRGKRPRR
jgi:hypothetical protein